MYNLAVRIKIALYVHKKHLTKSKPMMKQLILTLLIISQISAFAQDTPIDFQKIDSHFLLDKIAKTNPGTWSLTKNSNVRHYGLTDTDFFKTFGNDRVGNIGTEGEISANDKAGFNYTAIHALVNENIELTNKVAELENHLKAIENDIQRLNEANTTLQTMLENIRKIKELEQMVQEMEYRVTNVEQNQEEQR